MLAPAPFVIQIPANLLGDPDGVLGSWHHPDPAPATMAICKNEQGKNSPESPTFCRAPGACVHIITGFRPLCHAVEPAFFSPTCLPVPLWASVFPSMQWT